MESRGIHVLENFQINILPKGNSLINFGNFCKIMPGSTCHLSLLGEVGVTTLLQSLEQPSIFIVDSTQEFVSFMRLATWKFE